MRETSSTGHQKGVRINDIFVKRGERFINLFLWKRSTNFHRVVVFSYCVRIYMKTLRGDQDHDMIIELQHEDLMRYGSKGTCMLCGAFMALESTILQHSTHHDITQLHIGISYCLQQTMTQMSIQKSFIIHYHDLFRRRHILERVATVHTAVSSWSYLHAHFRKKKNLWTFAKCCCSS